MKTRLRRWYWSSVRPGGQPLEYVGDPFEKLLGFLIAVVIMAFYLGIVNLILMFVSFSLLAAPGGAYAVSALGVVPIIFYAQYRSRRYVLARTRWRAVRFGLEPGAWGYAAEATRQWILTLLTLGWWWPRKAFYLEKFKTDRTYFGTARLRQGGDAADLYPGFIHVYFPALLFVGSFALALAGEDNFGWFSLAALVWMVFGTVYYRAFALRYLTSQKRSGDIRLESALKPRRLMRIYIFGYSISALISFLPIIALGVGLGIAMASVGDDAVEAWIEGGASLEALPPWVFTVVAISVYFLMFLAWSVLTHVFVTMPLWRHVSETLSVHGATEMARIGQRARDEFEEAEGFAEALDVGAAL